MEVKPLYNEEKKKKLVDNCIFLKIVSDENSREYCFLDKNNLFPVANLSLSKNKESNVFNVSGSYSESGYGKLLYLMSLMDVTKDNFYMSSSFDGSMRGYTLDIWNDFVLSNQINSEFYREADFKEGITEMLFDNREFFVNKYSKKLIESVEEIDDNEELIDFMEKNNLVLDNVYLKCKKNPDEFYHLFTKISENYLKNKTYDTDLIKNISSESFSIYYEDDYAQENMKENKTFKINNFYKYFDKEKDIIYFYEENNNTKLTIISEENDILFHFDIEKNKDAGIATLKDFHCKESLIEIAEDLFHFILVSDESGYILENHIEEDLESEYEIYDYPVVLSLLKRKAKIEKPNILDEKNNLSQLKTKKIKI